MNNQEEIWKDVPNYDGLYQVSNLGRVRRIDNKKLLKVSFRKKGYSVCVLFSNKRAKTFYIHQLVAMAFLEHKPCGMKLVVDHINNIKTDNRLENLQIITNRQNLSKDKVGTSKFTGVSWNNHAKKWLSQIRINKKSINLGYFDKEIDAHLAYQNKLKEIS